MKRRLFLASATALSGAAVGSAIVTEPALATKLGTGWSPSKGGGRRLSDAGIAARLRLFGPENVDPQTGALPEERVVASWLSNSSFAVAVGGRLLYLDTFISRLEVERGRTPLVIADLVDARPDAVLLGHGHGDHADNAAYIAAMTGATIYASEETCAVLAADFARLKADPLVNTDPQTRIPSDAVLRTVPVTSADSVPGTEMVRLDVLEPFAQVVAFRHLHSVAVPQDPEYPPPRTEILVDPRDSALFPSGTSLTPGSNPQPGQMNLRTGGGSGGTVSIYFHITLRHGSNFSFGWQNTAGALKEGIGNGWPGTPEDGERIRGRLASLPQTDLHLATASTANYTNNGLRDLIHYQSIVRPRIYVPNHLTSGTRTREGCSLAVYAGYLEQMNLMGVPDADRPHVRWVIDPVDYLQPLSFDTDDDTWRDRSKKDRIKALDRIKLGRPRTVKAFAGTQRMTAEHTHSCEA
ncbi:MULTISPECIES: MBL fold metallo-hydrolase [unclassified Solwaraspora]|uniref:MBL fold metallo-hydrolase n=1 Tax=unclassified Solwaraspora TaxID=2627926 RepID=UPI00259BECFD|nr:hypothetical protein [Solwaraspora sp. WMMA2056]WJK40833.1 hypothetical protein O7608_31455 [Solwaraspora sp. WMMA2056]